MRTSKLMQAARAAQEAGYIYLYSVVKSHYNTTYYHVVPIDAVLREGRWIPARIGVTANGARCRIGQSWLPDGAINKTAAIGRYTS